MMRTKEGAEMKDMPYEERRSAVLRIVDRRMDWPGYGIFQVEGETYVNPVREHVSFHTQFSREEAEGLVQTVREHMLTSGRADRLPEVEYFAEQCGITYKVTEKEQVEGASARLHNAGGLLGFLALDRHSHSQEIRKVKGTLERLVSREEISVIVESSIAENERFSRETKAEGRPGYIFFDAVADAERMIFAEYLRAGAR